MYQRAFIHLITLTIVLCPSAGELVITPRATEAKVGDTTYFNCSTNLTVAEIFWEHNDEYIYTGDVILDPYHGRFEIDRNASNGSHNLVIHSVKPGDAGQYICVDNEGGGRRQSAQLIVLDNDPECRSNIKPDGVIGENTFNIPPDEVQLTCSVTYHGNIPPQMEWKKFEELNSIREGVTSSISSNNITYILKLTGEISLDKSSYVCQTTRSTRNQYWCHSEAIKVLYFNGGNMIEQNVFRGTEITCFVSNNTFPCNKEWHYGNDIYDEKITADLLGEHVCLVKCNIRGNNYNFHARKALVVEPTKSMSGILAAAVVVLSIVIVLIVLIAVLTVKYKKKKYAKREYEHFQQMLEEEEILLSVIEKHIRREEGGTNEYEEETEYEDETQLLFQIKNNGKEKKISGVAILSGKLFLIHEDSSVLEVYDFNGHDPRKILNVKEVVSAVDICSCQKNNCLYIMDKKNPNLDLKVKKKAFTRQVFKISVDGKVEDDWSTKDNVCGFLSASREGNVIITDQDKHRFLEYSSDGGLVRDVDLTSCTRPWHTIKLDDDKYLVSHGTYDNPHRVCLVDRNGTVREKFGSETHGSTKNELHIPYHLAVTSKCYLFIADQCNNRVLLLDEKLEFKTKVVAKCKQRFLGPRRMCLNGNWLVVVIAAGDPKNKQKTLHMKERTLMQKPNLQEQNKVDTSFNKAVSVEDEVEKGETSAVIDTSQRNGVDDEIEMVDFSPYQGEKRKIPEFWFSMFSSYCKNIILSRQYQCIMLLN